MYILIEISIYLQVVMFLLFDDKLCILVGLVYCLSRLIDVVSKRFKMSSNSKLCLLI